VQERRSNAVLVLGVGCRALLCLRCGCISLTGRQCVLAPHDATEVRHVQHSYAQVMSAVIVVCAEVLCSSFRI
jgi:hypothetical protein